MTVPLCCAAASQRPSGLKDMSKMGRSLSSNAINFRSALSLNRMLDKSTRAMDLPSGAKDTSGELKDSPMKLPISLMLHAPSSREEISHSLDLMSVPVVARILPSGWLERLFEPFSWAVNWQTWSPVDVSLNWIVPFLTARMMRGRPGWKDTRLVHTPTEISAIS